MLQNDTPVNGVEHSTQGLDLTKQYIDLVGVYQDFAVNTLVLGMRMPFVIGVSQMKFAGEVFKAAVSRNSER